jgi:hypothetical protein
MKSLDFPERLESLEAVGIHFPFIISHLSVPIDCQDDNG